MHSPIPMLIPNLWIAFGVRENNNVLAFLSPESKTLAMKFPDMSNQIHRVASYLVSSWRNMKACSFHTINISSLSFIFLFSDYLSLLWLFILICSYLFLYLFLCSFIAQTFFQYFITFSLPIYWYPLFILQLFPNLFFVLVPVITLKVSLLILVLLFFLFFVYFCFLPFFHSL